MIEQIKPELAVHRHQWEPTATLANPGIAVLIEHLRATPTVDQIWCGCGTPAKRFVFSPPERWRIAVVQLAPEFGRKQLEGIGADFTGAVITVEREFAAVYPAEMVATRAPQEVAV